MWRFTDCFGLTCLFRGFDVHVVGEQFRRDQRGEIFGEDELAHTGVLPPEGGIEGLQEREAGLLQLCQAIHARLAGDAAELRALRLQVRLDTPHGRDEIAAG